MKTVIMFCASCACLFAFGRGESWMPKPPEPPPVATLTNEARYIGWNVRWNDLPKSEQDEYILRAERIMR